MSAEEASAGEKPNFAGKYVLVRNENFDDFLAANGMMLLYSCSLLGGSEITDSPDDRGGDIKCEI